MSINPLTSTTSLLNLFQQNYVNITMLQGNSQIITMTPEIDLTQVNFSSSDLHVVTDIVNDQNNAVTAINQINESLASPNIMLPASLSSAIGFTNLWNAYYPTIQSLADNIFVNNNNNELITGFAHLKKMSDNAGSSANQMSTALDAYISQLKTNLISLRVDQRIFDNYLTANGTPADLENQFKTIRSQMEADNNTLSQGASKQALGVLIITAVVVGEIFVTAKNGSPKGGEVAGKVITYSFQNLIQEGIQAQSKAAIDWQNLCTQYADLLALITFDQSMFINVCNLINAVSSYINYLIFQKTIFQGIEQQWNNLSASMQSFMVDVQNATGTTCSQLVADVEAFNDAINSFGNQVLTMQQNTIAVLPLLQNNLTPAEIN